MSFIPHLLAPRPELLSPDVLSSFIVVTLAALVTSLCHQASMSRSGTQTEKSGPSAPWQKAAAVGLDTMSGLGVSLLVGFICEQLTQSAPDIQVRIGLGILGAYQGGNALRVLWAVITLAARVRLREPKN